MRSWFFDVVRYVDTNLRKWKQRGENWDFVIALTLENEKNILVKIKIYICYVFMGFTFRHKKLTFQIPSWDSVDNL